MSNNSNGIEWRKCGPLLSIFASYQWNDDKDAINLIQEKYWIQSHWRTFNTRTKKRVLHELFNRTLSLIVVNCMERLEILSGHWLYQHDFDLSLLKMAHIRPQRKTRTETSCYYFPCIRQSCSQKAIKLAHISISIYLYIYWYLCFQYCQRVTTHAYMPILWHLYH